MTHQINWPSVKIFLREYVLGLVYAPNYRSPYKYLEFTKWENWTGLVWAAKQLVQRGYLDYEIRDVDEAFARWALPRLERFLKITFTYPIDYYSSYPIDYYSESSPETNPMDRWKGDIEKIIEAFRLILAGYDGTGPEFATQEEFNQYDDMVDKKIQEGLDLFAKNVRTMWD
jgi:hypothetical protein